MNFRADRFLYSRAALDPEQGVTSISTFSNASAPVFWRPPIYDVYVDLETNLDTPEQLEQQQIRAAVRQRISERQLSVRSLVTRHVLRESFGTDERAKHTQLDMLSMLGAAVQDGADIRIVMPGADCRRFINRGDFAIVEREKKANLYVQATSRGDLVLADETLTAAGGHSYTRAVESFNYVWEEDPMVLREPRAILNELAMSVDVVRALSEA